MTKTSITLSHIDHTNARRMEYFLNALPDALKEVPFSWQGMNMAERLIAACRFISTATQIPITITVFFCNSYAEGIEVAKANNLPYTAKAKWSINGDLMYLVETDDEDKLTDVLSLFAGEE